MYDPNTAAVAFHGHALVAEGLLRHVAHSVKHYSDRHPDASVLTFDAVTSRPIELDLRGTADEVVARLEAAAPVTATDCATATAEAPSVDPQSGEPSAAQQSSEKRGPGRPKLGVVAREVTLLPRHWEWLAAQPGGASVTLRKLVEQARKSGAEENRKREARDAVYRFLYAVAGDLADFEEVSRALYAGDAQRFTELTAGWPADVRHHARLLASHTFEESAQ